MYLRFFNVTKGGVSSRNASGKLGGSLYPQILELYVRKILLFSEKLKRGHIAGRTEGDRFFRRSGICCIL